jgi:adenylate cyclase
VIQRALDRAYRRLGPRYPQTALVAQTQFGYLVWLSTVAALALYVDMSSGEFLRLFLVGLGQFIVFNAVYARVARRLLTPVVRWLEGQRDAEATQGAWTVAVSVPWQMVRREVASAPLGVLWWLNAVAWSIYAALELDFPVYAGLALIVGSLVYSAYQMVVRFFGVERLMRPVLDEIARHLPDEGGIEAPGIPLRLRLLAALPAINVITAVFVTGVVGVGSNDLSDLALAVVIAFGVASTVSLGLTLLVSNSVTYPIKRLFSATERVAEGDFRVRVPVVTTDETGGLTRAFNRMVAGLAERDRIREAFGTYVDREVAEHILREGTSLEGEEVEVTMMFIDVRDFTGFAERATAPEVVATINRLFERAVPIIHVHKGHVDKFVGDGLLAVFGAPRRQTDHADQALAASLEIERAVAEEFGGQLQIGIGLNSGIVVAGNVGGAGRLEFSVIGDPVNVAARVEAATRHTGDTILISARTRELLRSSAVSLTERPNVALKGKREPLSLYAPRAAVGVVRR